MFHFTIVVSLCIKQKSRKVWRHSCYDNIKKDMRYIYHFAGIFSLFNFYNNLFCGKGIFCKQIAKYGARKKFHLGAL